MEANKDIVIIGGSYGGVSAAHYILKHVLPALPNKASYHVKLISSASQTMCRPACPRALISDSMFPQDKLFVDTSKLFEQYANENFTFIHGSARHLDHKNRVLTISTSQGGEEKINYLALVIATGGSTPSPLLGMNKDEQHLKESWKAFRKALPSARNVVIAGGGPAGVETAAELGEHLNGRAGWFQSRLKDPKVPITIVTSGSQLLPALRPSIARKAEEYLAQVGVTVIKNSKVAAVQPEDAGRDSENFLTPADLTLVTLGNDQVMKADLFIPATGLIPNTAFMSPELLTSDGRIETNPTTLRVDKAGSRVYAIGDVGSYARPAVHLILNAIPVLCANVKRDLSLLAGQAEGSVAAEREYKDDKTETQLVPIGKAKGVGAAMGYRLPSFLVWLIKGRDYWLWTTGGLWSGKQWNKES